MDKVQINLALDRLGAWVVAQEFRAYDPFDGLGSPLAQWITGEDGLSVLLRTAWQQVVLRSPLNLRPWLGIHPEENYKAMAFFALGYFSRHQLNGNVEDLTRAVDCLKWLEEKASRNYSGLCWSNPHNYQSRLFYLPRGVPTVVGTAHVARAYLAAFELTGRDAYLRIARSTCDFILRDLPRHVEEDGFCFSYIPTNIVAVHNANLLAAAVLMRVYRHTSEPELFDAAHRAVVYTVKCQRPQGSWYYGEATNLQWIDNFHTGYVLDALKTCIECGLVDSEFRKAVDRGIEYFVAHFFGAGGEPFMFVDKPYPIDIQGAAQSIETLAFHSDTYPELLDLAYQVTSWTIKNMQARNGYFYFRVHQWVKNKVPCIHWGQATMFAALALLMNTTREFEIRSSKNNSHGIYAKANLI